uniref:Uncharacterized protein n=1 Tax=Candidatus Giovannonibacteria bacterium GW2011_GWF2_42_19 TaxID=1618659 RepID=A0A0G0ZIX5_9BACT|nr:MAG: hypothetical protein UV11_C0006G0029 [Candidatus Giovannonibacteria bacterium GW2011_GWF2_42_19]
MSYKENMVLFQKLVEDIRKDSQALFDAFIQKSPIVSGNHMLKVTMVVTVEKIPALTTASVLKLKTGSIRARKTDRVLKGTDWDKIMAIEWMPQHRKILNFLRATDNAPITEKELEVRRIPCSYSDQQYINLIFRSKAPEYRLLNVERYRQDLVSSDHHLKVFIVEERVKPLPEQIAVKAE